MKSGFRGVFGAAGIIGLCLVALVAVPVSAAPVTFGAKLTPSTQAQNAQTCHQIAPGKVPLGGVCTWVAEIAFENGSHFTAPQNGTIHHLTLVSCDAGKFVLQLVKKNANGNWKAVVSDNQVIKYVADPRQIDGDPDTECGGPDGTDFIIQPFTINIPVLKGEYIAVRTAKLGTLHCSGDNMPLYYPALQVGQPFRGTSIGTGCGMLVRLRY